jgi:hypothetical protein
MTRNARVLFRKHRGFEMIFWGDFLSKMSKAGSLLANTLLHSGAGRKFGNAEKQLRKKTKELEEL